jgi:hypothetical protein
VWSLAELQTLWMRIYANQEAGRSWVVQGKGVRLDPVRVLELLAEVKG